MGKIKQIDPLLYERGQRVRAIRLALRLTRPRIERDYGISRGTLQNWEDARFGGLGERGALRLIEAFAKEGIPCTVEWLLYGLGADPLLEWRGQNKTPAKLDSCFFNKQIEAELGFFHAQHPNAIDMIMPDAAMEPRIYAQELIAGVRYFGEDLEQVLGQDCIIQTQQGDILVRRLQRGHEKHTFNLICPYMANKQAFPDIKNVALFSAAPVIWIRRP